MAYSEAGSAGLWRGAELNQGWRRDSKEASRQAKGGGWVGGFAEAASSPLSLFDKGQVSCPGQLASKPLSLSSDTSCTESVINPPPTHTTHVKASEGGG